jgi:hypothetical protein
MLPRKAPIRFDRRERGRTSWTAWRSTGFALPIGRRATVRPWSSCTGSSAITGSGCRSANSPMSTRSWRGTRPAAEDPRCRRRRSGWTTTRTRWPRSSRRWVRGQDPDALRPRATAESASGRRCDRRPLSRSRARQHGREPQSEAHSDDRPSATPVTTSRPRATLQLSLSSMLGLGCRSPRDPPTPRPCGSQPRRRWSAELPGSALGGHGRRPSCPGCPSRVRSR